MIERMPCGDGLVFLPPFWTQTGIAGALRFVAGPVRGDGPWKVGDAVVTVLGCHGSEPGLAGEFAAWQSHLQQLGAAYPRGDALREAMREHAAKAGGAHSVG